MMGHPLKQGLKPQASNALLAGIASYDGTSIKTRIETWLGWIGSRYISAVMMGHPLKQGLKPIIPTQNSIHNPVMMGHPLKQGLKLYFVPL